MEPPPGEIVDTPSQLDDSQGLGSTTEEQEQGAPQQGDEDNQGAGAQPQDRTSAESANPVEDKDVQESGNATEQDSKKASQSPLEAERAQEERGDGSEPSQEPQIAQQRQESADTQPPSPDRAPDSSASAPEQANPAPADTSEATPSSPVGQAPPPTETRPIQVADLLEQRSILTPRGIVVVDPQLQFSNSSVTHVTIDGYTILPALVIGAIDVRSVRRDTVTAAVGLRYGATNRLEFELRFPYVYRSDQTISRPLNSGTQENTVTKLSDSAQGDIEFSTRYQLNNGDEGTPFFVAGLRIKSDTGKSPFEIPVDENKQPTGLATGTGFWAAQPSFTFTFPSDPAVFYGGVSYLWNKKRRIDETIGVIEPGNAAGFNFGMGLALNQNASFNLGYSHNVVQQARQNGEILKGSERLQVGALAIGISYRTGRSSNFNFGLGIGVTQDAPDVQVSFSIPFNFRLHE